KGGPMHEASYFLEASLWTKAVHHLRGMKGLGEIHTTFRAHGWDQRPLGAFYRSALVLQRCYDSKRSMTWRLSRLGEMLDRVDKLGTIDKEVLVWAAATRWLLRNKAFRFASLTLAEYVSTSLRLSSGRNDDALGCMRDVIDRDQSSEDAEIAKDDD